MNIYLETVDNRRGTILDIGVYHSPVVPRIGEKISFRLTAGIRTPTGEELPYPGTVLFQVVDVRYAANNTMQTEDWQVPHTDSNSSESVAVRVVPVTTAEGESSQNYITRIAQKQ